MQRHGSGDSGTGSSAGEDSACSAPPPCVRSTSPALPSPSPPAMGRHRRVLSTLAAKKRVASALSESAVGRATVLRVLGPEGDAVVSALKSAATKLDDRATAKQMKKDLFKWALKAAVLWQHGKLTRESTAPLRRPAQVCFERMLDEVDRRPAGARDMRRVSREMAELGALLRPLLEPHARDKNVVKVERLVGYFADADFLTRLFNDAALAEERDAITAAVRAWLLPLPRALLGQEALLQARARAALLQQQTEAPRLALCLGDECPDMSQAFAAHLDARDGTRDMGVMLRFLRAEQDFALLASPALRAARGRVLLRKFLAAPGARPLSQDALALAELQRALEAGSPGKEAFKPLRGEFLDRLQGGFHGFLQSPAFADLAARLRGELAELQTLLREEARDQSRAAAAADLQLPAPPTGRTCAQAV